MISARVPAVTITIALEAPIDVDITGHSDTEDLRFRDWLSAHPEFLALIERALELRQAVAS